ncbi:MAG: AbrB/MazE/SpoVT family DNA-binding domain-containing protein [Nitrososphaerales archaeon]|nr:AbrB/MazE/SpoVT family DNA-binding domain-containing protein [Nitrososphaerales archaeon]
MKKQVQEMEFTKASSKGQVVIPTKIRKRLDIKEGSVFAVAAEKDMIVLKKVESGLSAEDLRSLRLVEEAWRDIAEGRYSVRSKEAFFKELKEWKRSGQ